MDGASIYILECADGSYYTGITRRSLEERVSEHAQGLIPDCYTFMRRPVKLIFADHYERITDAIAAERRIKGWSRAKKEAYMRGDFAALTVLAKRGPKGSDWGRRVLAALRDARFAVSSGRGSGRALLSFRRDTPLPTASAGCAPRPTAK